MPVQARAPPPRTGRRSSVPCDLTASNSPSEAKAVPKAVIKPRPPSTCQKPEGPRQLSPRKVGTGFSHSRTSSGASEAKVGSHGFSHSRTSSGASTAYVSRAPSVTPSLGSPDNDHCIQRQIEEGTRLFEEVRRCMFEDKELRESAVPEPSPKISCTTTAQEADAQAVTCMESMSSPRKLVTAQDTGTASKEYVSNSAECCASIKKEIEQLHMDVVKEVGELFKNEVLKSRCRQAEAMCDLLFPASSLEALGYVVDEEICRGSQALVTLAKHASTNSTRCIKSLDKSQMKADTFELFKAEAVLLFDLGTHPNLGGAFETFHDDQAYHLVQPHYCGGDLLGLKQRAICAGVIPTKDWWYSIFHPCFEALTHMHSKGIMHCDIKEANIMLEDDDLNNPKIVIIDFGVAQRALAKRDIIYGTPGYIPPEVWDEKLWHPRSDIFSMGVVMIQVLLGQTGIFTENARTYKEIKQATKTRTPPFELMPTEFPSFTALAKRLLQKDFKLRPTASEVTRVCS